MCVYNVPSFMMGDDTMIVYAKQTLDESGSTPVFTYDFDVDRAWVNKMMSCGKMVILHLPAFEGSLTVKKMPEQYLPVIAGNDNIGNKLTVYKYAQTGTSANALQIADDATTGKLKFTINGAKVT